MQRQIYRYSFASEIAVEEIENTLLLGIGLMENMYGSARVRLHLRHFFDAAQRKCVVDAGTSVGARFNRLLAALLIDAIGSDNFHVERVERKAQPSPQRPGFPPAEWN